MLEQPMMDKLTAMRLTGMVEALKNQQQDPAAGELSFLERLSMLVDQQWNWRQNQALARRLTTAKLRGNACVEDIDYRTPRNLDKSVIRALTQESAWVRNHEHVFVLGPTGSGKIARGIRGSTAHGGLKYPSTSYGEWPRRTASGTPVAVST